MLRGPLDIIHGRGFAWWTGSAHWGENEEKEETMSIKLMSAIFATKFSDLKDATGKVTKASTAMLVLFAFADHVDEEGDQ